MLNIASQNSLAMIAMDTLEARALLAQRPFSVDPYRAPGLIEAENFDLGGKGEAYKESDAIQPGNISISSEREGGYRCQGRQ